MGDHNDGVRRFNWPRLLTAVALAVGLAVFISGFTSARTGRPEGLPSAIVSFTPGPGDRVLRQIEISVELQPIYTGALIVDGFEVTAKYPKAQRNILSFQAGPDTEITEFRPGVHSVRLVYWRQTDTRADSLSYYWEFTTT